LLGPTVYVTIGMTMSKVPGSRSPRFFSFPFSGIVENELALIGNLVFWCGIFATFGFVFGRRGRSRG
jgi:hypothetical protein